MTHGYLRFVEPRKTTPFQIPQDIMSPEEQVGPEGLVSGLELQGIEQLVDPLVNVYITMERSTISYE